MYEKSMGDPGQMTPGKKQGLTFQEYKLSFSVLFGKMCLRKGRGLKNVSTSLLSDTPQFPFDEILRQYVLTEQQKSLADWRTSKPNGALKGLPQGIINNRSAYHRNGAYLVGDVGRQRIRGGAAQVSKSRRGQDAWLGLAAQARAVTRVLTHPAEPWMMRGWSGE